MYSYMNYWASWIWSEITRMNICLFNSERALFGFSLTSSLKNGCLKSFWKIIRSLGLKVIILLSRFCISQLIYTPFRFILILLSFASYASSSVTSLGTDFFWGFSMKSRNQSLRMKGYSPNSIKQNIIPKEYISALSSYSPIVIISGAIEKGLPKKVFNSYSWGFSRANPKSPTFTTSCPSPPLDINIFSIFKSRCMMIVSSDLLCMYSKHFIICFMQGRASFSLSLGTNLFYDFLYINSLRLPLSQYSCIR